MRLDHLLSMELIEPAYVGVDEPLGRWLTLYKLDLEVAVQDIFKIKSVLSLGRAFFIMLFLPAAPDYAQRNFVPPPAITVRQL